MARQKTTATLDLLTVGTLAAELGCSAALVRWYESRGIIIGCRLRSGAYAMRVYDQQALEAARIWRARPCSQHGYRAGRSVA